jgi:hypothetical protein
MPALLAAFSGAADFGKVTSQKVAEGVYLFTTTPYADVGLSGNSVAILSDEGVLVLIPMAYQKPRQPCWLRSAS